MAPVLGIEFLEATAAVLTLRFSFTIPAAAFALILSTLHFKPPSPGVLFRLVTPDPNLLRLNFAGVIRAIPYAAFFLFKKVAHAAFATVGVAYVPASDGFIYNALRYAIRVPVSRIRVLRCLLLAPALDLLNLSCFRDALVACWMIASCYVDP